MRAATRTMIMQAMKAMTTGLMDESPTRSSGVGSLLEGRGSLMVSWMPKRRAEDISEGHLWVDSQSLLVLYECLRFGYSSRPGRDMSSRMASLGLLLR